MSQIAFPARRQEARPWKDRDPVQFAMTQLAAAHEDAFVALRGVMSYFGATHCPSDEEVIQRQWHTFARAVWNIVADPNQDDASRFLSVATWSKENMPVCEELIMQ